MPFHFTWLEDFLALAATGNFSRAAEQRHSSQPAFSRRIRALEEWLGVDLVDRSTQPARLTPAGEWFRSTAEDLLARTARLPGQARQVADAQAVTLRIASTHALSFTFLPRWLLGLESTLRLGPVELSSDVLERCEAQMQQGRVHFVLGHAHPDMRGVLDSGDYLSARIGDDQLVAVARPGPDGAALHRLDPPSSSEAAGAPVLAYSEESGLGRVVRAVLGAPLEALRGPVVFTAHLASVLRSMALEGRGIAWLPRSLILEDLEQRRLVTAGPSHWNVDLAVRLYRPREMASPVAQDFWNAATGA